MNNKNNIIFCSDEATDNYIELEFNNEICWINNLYVDPENVKLFLLLIKSSILKAEKKGCTKYHQLVSSDDWNSFLKYNEEWRIIRSNQSDGSILIESDIKIASELLIDSFLRNNTN